MGMNRPIAISLPDRNREWKLEAEAATHMSRGKLASSELAIGQWIKQAKQGERQATLPAPRASCLFKSLPRVQAPYADVLKTPKMGHRTILYILIGDLRPCGCENCALFLPSQREPLLPIHQCIRDIAEKARSRLQVLQAAWKS